MQDENEERIRLVFLSDIFKDPNQHSDNERKLSVIEVKMADGERRGKCLAAWVGVWTAIHFSDPASSFADKSFSDSAAIVVTFPQKSRNKSVGIVFRRTVCGACFVPFS
jgi:hypothetical protein